MGVFNGNPGQSAKLNVRQSAFAAKLPNLCLPNVPLLRYVSHNGETGSNYFNCKALTISTEIIVTCYVYVMIM